MSKKVLCLTLLIVVSGVVGAWADELEWIRAAYYDSRYPTAWGGGGEGTRDALETAGYEILDADQLKTWMDARIADKQLSVVVFCRDVVPDTVVESQSANCTFRKYLDSGGKIVWYADIPFYYWGHADGNMDTWGDGGAPAVLGFNTSSAPRDGGMTAAITAAGAKWGLTQTWTSQRPLAPSVTTNVTILATDGSGNAPAWAKHYVANDNFRGFVRFRDTGGQADVQDIMRVAEYISLKASSPQPADGTIGVTAPLLQWDPGSFALWHDVYFGTTPDLGPDEFRGRQMQMMMMYWHLAGLEAGVTYYWRIDEVEADGTVRTGDVWNFTAAPVTAYTPSPRNGDKWIDPNTSLTWRAGQSATQHDLYFGTDEAAVVARDAGVFQGSQVAALFEPGTLALETTYYWVVDEVNGGTYEGELWSFTTGGGGGGGAKGEYFNGMALTGAPGLTRIDQSIDFNWGDPGGPGAPIGVDQFSVRWTADLEIAVADTYTFITSTDDGARLWLNDALIVDRWVDQGTADALSMPMDLEPGIYSLRMEYYENGGGAVAQLSWQTPTVARQIIPPGPLQPPVRAKAIYPQDDAVDVPQDLTLMWSAGEKAATHDVYFGDDEAAVAAATPASAGIYRGSQMLEQTTLTPGALEWNKTYYWRIDEINAAEPDSPWAGPVWSFTTADFIVVDDFESYTDEVVGRIFQTWIDGWGYTEPPPGDPGNGTGATVGYLDPPFAEQAIVHGGGQSMPFDYNNVIPPYYSETERTWAAPQDWTVNGVTDLSLWVRGYAAASAVNETAPGAFSITGEGADIWGSSDQFTYVYKTLNGDGSLVARVVSNGEGSNNWAKGGVMIRDTLAAGSTHSMQVITGSDGNGASFQWRPVADDVSSNSDAVDAVAPPYWVKIERLGNSISGSLSPNGTTWTQQGTSQVIFMTNPCYIGLCVTSHAAGENRTFEFDSVTATGSVGGQWQALDVGLTRNVLADLYVVIQDSSGQVDVATNPDPSAVAAADWTEWPIPLSEFDRVALNRVKKMFIGVGNRDFPTPGGAGMLFIDDIRVVKPEPPAAE